MSRNIKWLWVRAKDAGLKDLSFKILALLVRILRLHPRGFISKKKNTYDIAGDWTASSIGALFQGTSEAQPQRIPVMYSILGLKIAYDDMRWHFDHKQQRPVKKRKDYQYLIFPPQYEVKNIVELHKLRQYLDLAYGILNKEFSQDSERLVVEGISSWIRENPPGIGIGWVYTSICAVRLANLSLLWELLPELAGDYEDVCEEIIQSVDCHIGFIYRFRSMNTSANNHLTVEIGAILIALSVFRSRQTEKGVKLQQLALKLFLDLLDHQNEKDGKNKENAFGYQHHVLLANFWVMSFVQRAGQVLPIWSIGYLEKMFTYYAACFDEYGNFFDYGDRDDSSVFGVGSSTPKEELYDLLWVGHRIFGTHWPQFLEKRSSILERFWPDIVKDVSGNPTEQARLVHFMHSGHGVVNFVTEKGRRLHLHFKAGDFGYLKIAAHSHCDLLSFYLTVDGEEVFVDTGTYCYRENPDLRKYFVSRYAHNTVCIDGKNLYENYGPNHWRYHGAIRSTLETVEETPDAVLMKGLLEGVNDYTLERQIKVCKEDGTILIADMVRRIGCSCLTSLATIFFTLGKNIEIGPLLSDGWLILYVADRIKIGLRSTALIRQVLVSDEKNNLGLRSTEFGHLERTNGLLLTQTFDKGTFIQTQVKIYEID